MAQTYRIEILDDRGQWVPAPGDATGWTYEDALAALPDLAETLTHDYPESPTTLDGLRIVGEADDIAVTAGAVRSSQFCEVAGARDVDVDIDLPSGRMSGVATVFPSEADPETYETAGPVDGWLSAHVLAAIDALGLSDDDRRRLLTDISMAAAAAAEEVR